MRSSAAAFGLAGGVIVFAGVLSILFGVPAASRDLPPVASAADLARRLPELSLPLSAAIGAVVAAAVSTLVAFGRLRARAAALELLVLGVAIEVSLVAAAHRIGYAADGAVLPAAVACLTGGIAIIVAAFAAAAAATEADATRARARRKDGETIGG